MSDQVGQPYFREGQVVVITGASAGLGRALVREYGRQRARIGLLARNPDGLEAARQEAIQLGGQAMVIPTDVAHWEQLEAAAKQIEAQFGPIDVWINNASVSVVAPFTQLQPAEFQRVTEVAYLGAVYGTQVALRRMIERQRGHIVLISDQAVGKGLRFQTAYAGAKSGLKGFYDSLRQELAGSHRGVSLSLIHLPALNTPRHELLSNRTVYATAPTGVVYQPDVAARAIARAASGGGKEYFIGLQVLPGIDRRSWIGRQMGRLLGRSEPDNPPKRADLAEPEHATNLWEPAPGDHGARGRYDRHARRQAVSLTIDTYRAVGATALAGLLFGAAALLRNRNRKE